MPKIFISGDFCPNLRLETIIKDQPSKVLGHLSGIIADADISITNLECPLTEVSKPIIKTGPHLKSSAEAARFLKESGFDIVTLANNHIMDHGAQGLQDTIESLRKAEVEYIGAGINFDQASSAYKFELSGVKISILNFAENEWSTTGSDHPGASPIDPVRNYKLIKQESSASDHVIVIAHGGHEKFSYPSPRMVELYRFYIDAGASVVINHHTHCISGYELYNNGFIHYSIGNFLFDHEKHKDDNWNFGAAVLLDISKEDIQKEIIYFKQCSSGPYIEELSSVETDQVLKNVDLVNSAIQNESDLKRIYDKFLKERSKMYRAYIEPIRFRLLNALQNRGLFPSFWSNRKKQFLLNLTRCESHREHLIRLLEEDARHSSK